MILVFPIETRLYARTSNGASTSAIPWLLRPNFAPLHVYVFAIYRAFVLGASPALTSFLVHNRRLLVLSI